MRKLLVFLLCFALLAQPLLATTTKTSYRATNQTVTITLTSLANSTSQSTGIRGSVYVDNTTNQDLDDLVTVSVTSASSGVSSTGTIVVYFFGCVGGTTTCTDAVTGTDAGQTLTNPTNLNKVQACNVVANSTAYICGPFSVANAFGGVVPPRWGVVIQNLSGAALAASGNSVVFDAIQTVNQ